MKRTQPRRTPLELVEARPEPAFQVTFDGAPLDVLPGQTIAAALWSAGITSWRSTRVEQRPLTRVGRRTSLASGDGWLGSRGGAQLCQRRALHGLR